MSSVVTFNRKHDLTKIPRDEIIEKFRSALAGKVVAAYFFGSFARNEVHQDSDLDLILVTLNPDKDFVKCAEEFKDLWDIFPALDLIVYSKSEFDQKNQNNQTAHWKKIKSEFLPII
jgi:predicted nucleotidyltransferase